MEQNIIIPGTNIKVSPMGLGTVDAGVKWGKGCCQSGFHVRHIYRAGR